MTSLMHYLNGKPHYNQQGVSLRGIGVEPPGTFSTPIPFYTFSPQGGQLNPPLVQVSGHKYSFFAIDMHKTRHFYQWQFQARVGGHMPPNLVQAPKFLIGSIVISLSRCCLPNDEGPSFFPRTASDFYLKIPKKIFPGRGTVSSPDLIHLIPCCFPSTHIHQQCVTQSYLQSACKFTLNSSYAL